MHVTNGHGHRAHGRAACRGAGGVWAISLFLMPLTFLASLQLAPHPKTSLACCVPFHPASQPPHTSSAALCASTALSCHVFELLVEAQTFCKPFGGLQPCAWPGSSMPRFSKALVWQQRACCWHLKHPTVTLLVPLDLQIFPLQGSF